MTKNFEAKVNQILDDGQGEIDQINEDIEDPSTVETAVKVKFDIEWGMTSIKFDVPKLRKRREDVSFDVPELHTDLEEIKFKVPATRMVEKCVTKAPKVIKVFPKPKIEMVCINVSIPEVYMKDVSIKLDMPKIRKRRIAVKFNIPEVHMDRIEIKTKVPKIHVKNVNAEIEEKKRRIEDVSTRISNRIERESQDLQNTMQEELVTTTSQHFDNERKTNLDERKQVEEAYNQKISEYKRAINTLKENKAVDHVATLEADLEMTGDCKIPCVNGLWW
ncbi:hypothetical protein [Chitinophaga sp. CF418]|uniref:hypothetical protein n=1 Tax=Chitinophaga sp. CF418 TaxID=1855287 RepID=UPI000924671B|nr:hypothetical protein [Chitinophaga sp. CF418]SHN24925.1 hypothetical protein SAMN05216311_107292 [Chitinophaga sp. CF418]